MYCALLLEWTTEKWLRKETASELSFGQRLQPQKESQTNVILSRMAAFMTIESAGIQR